MSSISPGVDVLHTYVVQDGFVLDVALALRLPAASNRLCTQAGAEYTGVETTMESLGAGDAENDPKRGVA